MAETIWVEHKGIGAEPRKSTVSTWEKLLAVKGWTICDEPEQPKRAKTETFDPAVKRREELAAVDRTKGGFDPAEIRRKELAAVDRVSKSFDPEKLRREQLASKQASKPSKTFDPDALRREELRKSRAAKSEPQPKTKVTKPSEKKAKSKPAKKTTTKKKSTK